MMGYSWKAVEAVTGAAVADLPNFTVDRLLASLGRSEAMTGTLPVGKADPGAPENWLAATDPWCVAILCIDDATQQVLGGGYLNGRVRTHRDVFTVPLVTAEGLLARRSIGTYTPTSTDQNTIASQLVTQFAIAADPGLNGWPASINVIGAAGQARDRTYSVNDRTTVLQALTELMGVQGGPEWCVTWQHLTGPERWLPVFNIGTRIGQALTPGLGPDVTFELGGTIHGGTVVDVEYTEDYSDGKGANKVTAYGTTAADGTTPAQTATYGGNPRQLQIDYQFNPSTSIVDPVTLLGHANARLALMRSGARSLSVAVQANAFPQLRTDWNLGDDVGYRIGGIDQSGRETVPSFPGGLTGTARVIGWQMNVSVPSPVAIPILGGV